MNVLKQVMAIEIRKDAKENIKKVVLFFFNAKRKKSLEVKNKTIARRTGLSMRTVQYIVRRLEEMEIIEVIRRGLNEELTKKLHSAMDFVNIYCLKVVEVVVEYAKNTYRDLEELFNNLGLKKKRDYGRRMKYDCPMCGGSLSVHLKNNKEVGYCHSCDKGMNVWTVLKNLKMLYGTV